MASNERQNITIPSPARSCTTYGKVVVLALGLTDVLIWEFGGRTRTVKAADLEPRRFLYLPKLVDHDLTLFSDPLRNDFFYGATLFGGSPQGSLAVYKFNRQRFVEGFQFPMTDLPRSGDKIWSHFDTICHRAGSFGDHVVLVASNFNAGTSTSLAPNFRPHIAIVTFNVFTNTFDVQFPDPQGLRGYNFSVTQVLPRWNNHVTPTFDRFVVAEPRDGPSQAAQDDPERPPIFSMRWARPEHGGAAALRRERSRIAPGHGWTNTAPSFALSLEPPCPFRHHNDVIVDVIQDDEFLIAITDWGYTAWDFSADFDRWAARK